MLFQAMAWIHLETLIVTHYVLLLQNVSLNHLHKPGYHTFGMSFLKLPKKVLIDFNEGYNLKYWSV